MTNPDGDSAIIRILLRKYEIYLKMLEDIAGDRDALTELGMRGDQSINQVKTIIHQGVGDIRVTGEVITMDGDHFGNISHSVVATRGSVAKVAISVGEQHGEQVADAIRKIKTEIERGEAHGLSQGERNEALQLLAEIANQGGNRPAVKPVIKALGDGLWKIIERAPPAVTACLEAWKVLQKIWH